MNVWRGLLMTLFLGSSCLAVAAEDGEKDKVESKVVVTSAPHLR
jgi:hypothetical protein